VSAGAANPRRRTNERRDKLRVVSALQTQGLTLSWAARGVGIDPTTAMRWRRREAAGEPLARRRGPRLRSPSITACSEAVRLVEQTHGLIGADALRHSVPGLSRRMAAAIKAAACRVLEHERRQQAERVVIAAPGILRGFDAMELASRLPDCRRFLLVAADGCVPYRTSWLESPTYDGAVVADILRRDFEAFGAPLVLRFDRASAHDVSEVRKLLEEHRVLALHGPSYHARFYGQLERQNREHRAWLALSTGCTDVDAMMLALNGRWRRSTLGWRTAEEVWQARPSLQVDRATLARDVTDRAAHLRRSLEESPRPDELAWRLAVKQALVERGLLRVERGGWC